MNCREDGEKEASTPYCLSPSQNPLRLLSAAQMRLGTSLFIDDHCTKSREHEGTEKDTPSHGFVICHSH